MPLTPPESSTSADIDGGGAPSPWIHSVQANMTPRTPASPATSSMQRIPVSKSRNDIFSAPSFVTPPRPPPSSGPSSAATNRSTTTRNGRFFDTPPATPSTIASASGASQQRSSLMLRPHTPDLRPSYGRSSTEERERERQRIRQNRNDIDFRLVPSKEFLLGEGRHSNVYLGAYRRRQNRKSADEAGPSSSRPWQLCAIKRLHPDRQSQLLGLDEGFALRRLGPHHGIVQLIDIRDEVLAPPSPRPPIEEQSSVNQSLQAESQADSRAPGSQPSGSATSNPHHGRSISDCIDSSLDSKLSTPIRHNRLASQPVGLSDVSGEVTTAVDGTEDDSLPESAAELQARREQQRSSVVVSPPSPDPPRLLILLELLPSNLAIYSKRHPDIIDLFFWLRVAIELSDTLTWLHDKGCVHSDLKPENILLDDNLNTKLCDFNSCLFVSPGKVATDGLGLGSPAWGAPELTKRGEAGQVSFPVDVFSLGAVLYSLATGVEPMARARSMIDMLHRRERFFITEENDRIARISVAEGGSGWAGSSTAGSLAGSRHGSLRRQGRASIDATNSTASPTLLRKAPSLRRKESQESLHSTASSVATISGKKLSEGALELLLQPSPMAGVLSPDSEKVRSSHHRAASLKMAITRSSSLRKATGSNVDGLPQDMEKRASLDLPPPSMRRTTSYNGGDNRSPTTEGLPQTDSSSSLVVKDEADDEGSPPSPPGSAELRSFLGEAFAEKRNKATTSTSDASQAGFTGLLPSLPSTRSTSSLIDEATPSEPDLSPYRDGSPALILPSGHHRLPQSALDLLEEMVSANPKRRPRMKEVQRRLKAIWGEEERQIEGMMRS